MPFTDCAHEKRDRERYLQARASEFRMASFAVGGAFSLPLLLCFFALRFAAVWFVILRSGLVIPAFGLVGRVLRQRRGWVLPYRPELRWH